MSKFGSFLGRKTSVVVPLTPNQSIVTPDLPPAPLPEVAPAPQNNVVEFEHEFFFPAATQLGEANEAVRNLLADAQFKLGELDQIKSTIGKLVDPVAKTLRDFEEAKSEKLSLQGILNTTRVANASLRNELTASEKKVAAFESECARLRELLAVAQQNVGALETTKAEQATELTARRGQINELQHCVQQQAAELQIMRDETRRARERVAASDTRMVELEAAADTARQKLMVSEKERAAAQASLDATLAESARVSRRLGDTESTLAATQARLRQTEATLAETETERARLSAEFDKTSEAQKAEINAQRSRFETLQARSTALDKLLNEARAGLAARADEIRTFERRLNEETLARNAVENKLGHIEIAFTDRDAQVKKLEQARTALSAHIGALKKAVDARETAYERAQQQLQFLEGRIQLLEGDIKTNREAAELHVEELNTQLRREKLERTMVEGALEAGRKDISRLLREIGAMQSPASVHDTETPRTTGRYHRAA